MNTFTSLPANSRLSPSQKLMQCHRNLVFLSKMFLSCLKVTWRAEEQTSTLNPYSLSVERPRSKKCTLEMPRDDNIVLTLIRESCSANVFLLKNSIYSWSFGAVQVHFVPNLWRNMKEAAGWRGGHTKPVISKIFNGDNVIKQLLWLQGHFTKCI